MKLDFIFTYLLLAPAPAPSHPGSRGSGRRGAQTWRPERGGRWRPGLVPGYLPGRRPGLPAGRGRGKGHGSKRPLEKYTNSFQNLYRRLIKSVLLFIGSVANYLESFNLLNLHVN